MTAQMKPNLEMAILELIAAHDGAWGWYQLDRALSERGFLGAHIPTVVHGLSNDGLVIIEGDPRLAASRYRITAAGYARLHKCVEGNYEP